MLIFLFLALFAITDGIFDSNDTTQILKFILYMISLFPIISLTSLILKINSIQFALKLLMLNIWEGLLASTFGVESKHKIKMKYNTLDTDFFSSSQLCTEDGKLQILSSSELKDKIKNSKIFMIKKFKNVLNCEHFQKTKDRSTMFTILDNIEDYFHDDLLKVYIKFGKLIIRDNNDNTYSTDYTFKKFEKLINFYLHYRCLEKELYLVEYKNKKNLNVLHRMALLEVLNLSLNDGNELCDSFEYFEQKSIIRIMFLVFSAFFDILLMFLPMIYYLAIWIIENKKSLKNGNENEIINLNFKFYVLFAFNLILGPFSLIQIYSRFDDDKYYVGFKS
jgi:hypothetical protein